LNGFDKVVSTHWNHKFKPQQKNFNSFRSNTSRCKSTLVILYTHQQTIIHE